MSIGTLIRPDALSPRGSAMGGGASASEGADALCSHYLDILPSRRAPWGERKGGGNVTERNGRMSRW
jgi:hypothetical protein